ncbi:hypothetical protein AXA44_18225 [Rhodococcus sp. SC4]|nr:hypothetical protein AXA44_18225 [Rhodococcus sp. SC4]
MANSKTAQGWPGDSVPVAVVTGAGEGIGRAIAHQLASDGLRIVVNDLHEDRAEAVRTEIEDAGGSAVLHAGDVSDRGDVERLSATVRDWAGRVDVLVNNAGIALPKVPTENQDVDRWQKEIDVLLRGPYLCSRQIGTDFMLPARFGRIVNIASIVGMVGFPMVNAYGPAKAGVVMLTKTLGAEWARHGVTVNAVAPGYIATTAVRGLCDKGKLDGAALRRRIPLGKLGTPEDIARTVSFLASPQSSYITGITVPVDGGWTAFGAAGDAYPADVN